MSLGKVLYSLRSSNEIVEVHDRDAIFHLSVVHTRNLQIRLIHEDGPNMTGPIHLRSQPRLNNHNSTRKQMAAHRLQRLVQPLNRLDITNRTEQTEDDIKLLIQ